MAMSPRSALPRRGPGRRTSFRPDTVRTGPLRRRDSLRRTASAVLALVLALPVAACSEGGEGPSSGRPGTASGGHGHDHGADAGGGPGAGLKAEAGGYRLVPVTGAVAAGRPYTFRFRIDGPGADGEEDADGGTGGRTVTAFVRDQSELMHTYVIRSDHTGFQHVHPTMDADGVWSVPLDSPDPGWWRLYGSFVPKESGKGVVLSVPYQVPGDATLAAMPEPSRTTTTDGYTLTAGGAPLRAGRTGTLTMTIARDGEPVTALQPYLESYAHVSAFHEGDGAFAHLHPTGTAEEGRGGGPELRFHVRLPDPGRWRLFVQFRTGGTLHTAAMTLRAD